MLSRNQVVAGSDLSCAAINRSVASAQKRMFGRIMSPVQSTHYAITALRWVGITIILSAAVLILLATACSRGIDDAIVADGNPLATQEVGPSLSQPVEVSTSTSQEGQPGGVTNPSLADTSRPHAPSSRSPVNPEFFRRNGIGEMILRYLTCIDFDCFEFEKDIARTGDEAVLPLLQLLQHGLPDDLAKEVRGDVRPRIVRLLGVIGKDHAVPHVVALIQDPDLLIRAGIAEALGQIGGDEALNALPRLLQDQDPLVREMTANVLGRLGRPEALPDLRKAAQVESLPHVKAALDEAIRSIERR